MSVYSRIAKRFGVDSTDEDSVDEFFLKVVPAMEADTRGAILQELMRNLGGIGGKGGSAGEPLEEIPLIPLDPGGASRRAKQPRSIDDQLNGIINQLVGNGITLEQALEAFEGKYIVAAMSASRGNVKKASSALGVHRSTLQNKLRSQSMLNGFVESIHPVGPRLSANRVRSRKGGADSNRTAAAMQKRRPNKSRLNKK
jgi:DNA-binding protein Fis